jgi:hypothetical protein
VLVNGFSRTIASTEESGLQLYPMNTPVSNLLTKSNLLTDRIIWIIGYTGVASTSSGRNKGWRSRSESLANILDIGRRQAFILRTPRESR